MQVDGDWVESGPLNDQNMKQPDRVAICRYAPGNDEYNTILKAAHKAGYPVDWEGHVVPLVVCGNQAYVVVMINAYKARKLAPAQKHFTPLTEVQPPGLEQVKEMLYAAWGHPSFKFSVRSPKIGTVATDPRRFADFNMYIMIATGRKAACA